MTAQSLLQECRLSGIDLTLDGHGGLKVTGPKGALATHLLDKLRRHKFEIMVMLVFGDLVTTGVLPPGTAMDEWDVDMLGPGEVPPCKKCGTTDAWQAPIGDLYGRTEPRWRCRHCDPPGIAPKNEGWVDGATDRARRGAEKARRSGKGLFDVDGSPFHPP